VYREGNAVAHCLARFARNIIGPQVRLESVPPFLHQCLADDVSLLS
jgi:hypothetical protein